MSVGERTIRSSLGRAASRAGVLVMAAAAALAISPEGFRDSILASAGAVASVENVFVLALAGLWLGLLGETRVAWARLTGLGLLAAAAGVAAGSALDVPASGGVPMAVAGVCIGALMVIWPAARTAAAVALALAAAAFGVGIGTGAEPAEVLGAAALRYLAVIALCGAAVLAAGVGLGRVLRGRRGPGMMRGLGVWAMILAMLLFTDSMLRDGNGFDATSSALAVRGAELTQEEVPELAHDLLEHIYRAFEQTEEAAIYDALAMVTEGDVLADLYLQKRAALAVEEHEGVQAELSAIELERATAAPRPGGYTINAVWRAMGSVGHWGHLHDRANRYEADLTVAPVGGYWKLTGFELLDAVQSGPPPVQ